jgi:hypothetical protein
MITLVYVSASTQHFSDSELVDLLTKAREKNTQLDVSGMLVYHDGNFLQVLEGPEQAVKSLFETINQDKRHRTVIKLFERPIAQRQFKDWSMAFRQLDKSDVRNLPGYSTFLDASWSDNNVIDHASLAYQLLLSFRETLR